ncbi:hypothetical protein [Jatrophihabitans lederbergiae]|uniref:hypothetical protein n=1 Tax=Jatrophihabitans lederbergiae TaxID=3075547 RepID=UPI0037BF00CB
MSALIAARAVGLLADFSTAGVLAPADVHVAMRLGALVNASDDRVLLAAALTVRGTRHGSVVLDLAEVATQIVADPTTPTSTAPRIASQPAPPRRSSCRGPSLSRGLPRSPRAP